MIEAVKQELKYISNGPWGYVIYKDYKNELKLFYEFGGGNCLVIISVPNVQNWTSETSIALEERLGILKFIAEQAVKDQAPNCNYELQENYIMLLTK